MKKRNILIIVSIIFILTLISFLKFYNKEEIISSPKIKYIFLFIGDGMSNAQVELTEIYQNTISKKDIDKQDTLSFTKFPTIGLRKNYSKNNYIPDSAASATALASGIITYNGSINTDINGKTIKPITYDLQKQNKKIGIITTVSLNHATPAAFYANAKNRNEYENIAYSLVDSNFDFFAGGDFYGIDKQKIRDYATEKKYTIINNENDLQNINKNNKNIILSPITILEEFLPLALDDKTAFNLANYIEKAIDTLDNDNGFFIMAESGLIDQAGHSNDAKSVIYETLELNDAVNVALDFANKHKDETLIIVTGDHETGGLTLGTENQNHKLSLEVLESQKLSYYKLNEYSKEIKEKNISYKDMLKYLEKNYGITNTDLNDVYNKILNGNASILKTTILSIINKNAGISYTTTYHTADRIPVYVYGPYNEKFAGIYNTGDFNKILKEIINIK